MTQSRLLSRLVTVAVLSLATLPALASSPADLQAFKAAIRAEYDQAEQAYNKGDAETLVNQLYSEDVLVVPPGPGLSIGRAQAIEGYKKHLGGKAKIVSFKTHLNGNIGIDWANMIVQPDDASQKPDVLKMLLVWEKRAGKWVSISIMFVPGAYPIPDGGAK